MVDVTITLPSRIVGLLILTGKFTGPRLVEVPMLSTIIKSLPRDDQVMILRDALVAASVEA